MIASKAVGPASSGMSWSAPAMTGATTRGGMTRGAAGVVRPGAQEVASSARRRGNRRRRAGPYTAECYYVFVYLSRPVNGGSLAPNWRYNSAAPAHENVSRYRRTRAGHPGHARRPSPDAEGERA